jgi:hypothetical protein
MSYSEQDGQVVLTMSKGDYGFLMFNLGACVAAQKIHRGSILGRLQDMVDRLNSGNPNYTPYKTEESR